MDVGVVVVMEVAEVVVVVVVVVVDVIVGVEWSGEAGVAVGRCVL